MARFFLILLVVLTCSCEVEYNTSTKPPADEFDETNAILIKQGEFIGINHQASGKVSVYESNERYAVVLDPYESQNGPDLKVYLSKTIDADSYINLGPLQSVSGTQTYFVPGSPNIDEYTYVHIWCERYSVEFARAALHE